MKEPIIDHSLLAYILSLLSIPENDATDTSLKTLEDTSFVPADWRLHTARGMIRFMDEMPGGFLIYHADQKEEIIYANKALLRICQCDTLEEFRELTGNSFQGFVHPVDLEAVEQSIREQIAKSQYDLDYVEYRMKRKDGTIRWMEDYGHFIHLDSVGDIFYVFIGDATEKREVQQKMLQKQLQKEQE